MAIQDLLFKKSFLTYSPFLPQASLNTWIGLWQSPGGGWGKTPGTFYLKETLQANFFWIQVQCQ